MEEYVELFEENRFFDWDKLDDRLLWKDEKKKGAVRNYAYYASCESNQSSSMHRHQGLLAYHCSFQSWQPGAPAFQTYTLYRIKLSHKWL